jgi:hypothetical protein
MLGRGLPPLTDLYGRDKCLAAALPRLDGNRPIANQAGVADPIACP